MQEARPLQQSSSRSLRQAASIADEGNRTHESFLQRLRRRSSSTGGQKQATVSTRPTVTVHVAALGSGQWTDEPSSTVSSADCAVDLDAHKVVKVRSISCQARTCLWQPCAAGIGAPCSCLAICAQQQITNSVAADVKELGSRASHQLLPFVLYCRKTSHIKRVSA